MRSIIEVVVSRHRLSLSATHHRRGSWRSWGSCAALACALILLPSLVKAADIDVQFVSADSVISGLNPTSVKFDIVYTGGSLKSGDGSTTLGKYVEVTPRYAGAAGTFNYTDGAVVVQSAGNIYYKMVRNFADPPNSAHGILVGGDGAFAGITGTITQLSLTVYRVTYAFP